MNYPNTPLRPSRTTTRVDNALALAIIVWTIASHVLSHVWRTRVVPRVFRRSEVELSRAISDLEREAERYNTTQQLHQYSKMQREVIRLQKELRRLQERRNAYEVDVVRTISSPTASLVPARARRGSLAAAIAAAGSSFSNSSNNNSGSAAARGTGGGGSTALSNREPTAAAAAKAAAGRETSGLVAEVCAFVVYNLPQVVDFAIKYGHVFLLLLVTGNRPALLPVGTDIPRYCLYIVASFIMFGDPGALGDSAKVGVSGSTGGGGGGGGGAAAADSTSVSVLDVRHGPACGMLLWCAMCLIAVKYALRVWN